MNTASWLRKDCGLRNNYRPLFRILSAMCFMSQGGDGFAAELRDSLVQRGYKVFLDVDNLEVRIAR